jgi:hypothetical protein
VNQWESIEASTPIQRFLESLNRQTEKSADKYSDAISKIDENLLENVLMLCLSIKSHSLNLVEENRTEFCF